MTKPLRVPEPYLDAWKALLRAHAATIGRIEARMAETGQIPLVEYDVLLELNGAPGGRLRMHELAQRVVLSRSGLTRLADRLQKQGYLQRVPDAEDRRGMQLVLTDQGREALRAAWPEYASGIMTYFVSHLNEDEARQVAALLGRIAAAPPERALK